MSWAPQVIADASGKWFGNSLRFATQDEAEANVVNLKARWMLVTDTRAVEVDEPVTARWEGGRTVLLPDKPALQLVTNKFGVDEWVR